MDKMEKAFWLVVIVWCLLRIILMGSQLWGNTDPQMHTDVLRHFSQIDIDTGKSYALYGFWLRVFWGFIYVGILIFFLKAGYFSIFWKKCGEFVGSGFFRQDLLFIICFLFFIRIISFPYSLYFGFWRESVIGFSNLKITGWLLLYCKSLIIGILLETIGIVILSGIIRLFPRAWPFAVPVVMGIFALGMTILQPLIITPLFYNQTLLPEGDFKTGLLEIVDKAGIRVNEIYVINESRYSKHTNAYFSGVGDYRRIVLYDNLISNHTPDEVALIFAHEIGHWQHNHVAWGLRLGTVGVFLIAVAYWWLFPKLAVVEWFGLTNLASTLNLPFLMIIFIIFNLLCAPIESQISQFMEKQADKAALALTGLDQIYIDAQVRLSKDNNSDLLPSSLRVFWLYSHPPVIERIKIARQP